ncbi:MAG: hypothetical protein HS101_02275 [Planctomycetia bacterium]|nr:hypothetical protein [Planctomycetia bacterium]OQY97729.1 MAG: hypothetical protein B6D36_18340 [Planctomycetes bacterium UTPLA1]
MSLNDLHAIRSLRERESHLFDRPHRAEDAQRVLFYSMDPWQLGVFEQFLHLAVELEGHEAVSVYFDGLLPLCAWENQDIQPPPHEVLRRRFEFMHDCFGIKGRGISTYVDATTARHSAEELVRQTPDAQLMDMRHRGLPIGKIALRDLTQYSLGMFDPRTPEEFSVYRLHLIHAVMSVDLADAILLREKPDIVVLVNGKSIMYSYMYELARMRGVSVTTWEEGGYFDASVVLANDDRAIDFPVDEASWQAARQHTLSASEVEAVDTYFARWRRQEARFYTYYEREETDFERIRRELDIPPDAKIVSLFTNIIWDTNALGKDRAFASMFDWICSTIDWAAMRPDHCLIIRAHPGETRLCFKTRTPIIESIQAHYAGRLSQNVRFVAPDSQFSSYEIAARSEHCAVYTSTLGAELSLMGASPLVCGTPFYSGKSLTADISLREQYFAILDGKIPKPTVDTDSLRKLLHVVIYRLVKRPEFFVGVHGHPQKPRIQIDSFENFPDSMPIFDGIVKSILQRRSFVGIPAGAAAVREMVPA